MSLIDYIRTLKPEQKVMIGSAGTFFFGGTAEDFLDNIDIYNGKITTVFLRREYSQRDKLRAAVQECFASLDTLKSTDFGDYEKVLKKKFADVQTALKKYLQARKSCDEYVALSQREVKEVKRSIVKEERDVLKIYVEGKETGKYWLYSETDGQPFAINMQGGTYEQRDIDGQTD